MQYQGCWVSWAAAVRAHVQSLSRDITPCHSFIAGGADKLRFWRKARKDDCIVVPTQTSWDLCKQILSLSVISMQEFSQIPAPVAVYCSWASPWSAIFSYREKRICSQQALLLKAKKRSNSPISACAADISRNDDSHYSMHPTKFNNNLTFFFCCSCFYDNGSPCCNFKEW